MPSPEALEADAIRSLVGERNRLRDAHLAGVSGVELVRSLSVAVDAAVAALWSEVVGERPGLALAALGGYGRGELSPHSDLDLMVLHGRRGAPDLARRLFYPLWDAGLEVGHAVRSVRECIKLARANFEAETSFLDARLVAGDPSLFEEFASAALAFTRKRGSAFAADARAALTVRHAKPGNASGWLEPNVKEGAGGLRDLATLGWLRRVFSDGLLDDVESREMAEAGEVLHRIRSHMHYLAGRRQDVLALDLQEPAAKALGWTDVDGWSAWDAFMRDCYRATRSVEHEVTQVFAELDPPRSRRAEAGSGAGSDVSAPIAAALVAAATRERIPVSRDVLRRVRDAPPAAAPVRWSDEARGAFFAALRAGGDALQTLDQVGALGWFLPEWDMVRCRAQHNVYHQFPVDVHAYRTVARLAGMPQESSEPIAAQVVRDVRDTDLLLLSGLLHDLGKGYPGDHSEAGERLARGIAARIGMDAARAETLAWLVRTHLLLVDVATRRDTGDENLVVEIAAQIGDPERLRMLYALSVADGLATGPTAWTPWKSALTAELFARMLRVLERGELTSRDARELVELRRAELRGALERHPPEKVEAHIAGMPRAYFLAFPTAVLIRHFALMADQVPPGEIRTHVASTDERELSELTLIAADRPGLFSLVSGALSLNGVNVVTAQIYTRSDGAALEVFRVTGALDPVIDADRWERVFDDVRACVRGDLALDALLEEKRRVYASRRPRGRPRSPEVRVDNGASDFYTVVEVHAADRIGLLYAITRTLAELELDIHLAKIATYGEEIVDAFYVRDLEGQKVDDAGRLAEMRERILAVLAER